ncbi:glycosyltransferase [Paenibacillus lautus]|uniref:glycosyltransferase n=1 Tax=Paenibacillus lautus TaxID=1401 RepID=UPI003D28D481
MNIAVDVLAILGPDSKNRGIGNYNVSQYKKIFQIDKSNNYFLLNFYEQTYLKEILNYSNNVKEFFFYTGENNFLIQENTYRKLVGDIVKKFIMDNQIDVFYITSPFDRFMSYDLDWLKDVKVVMTVYDIIPYLFKERYLKPRAFYDEYMSWVEKVKRADKILAISKSVKDDLVEHLKIDTDKIEVIYAGVEEHFRKLEIEDVEDIQKMYGISSQFVMCTGGDDDRKNIAELIIAYSKMPANLIEKFQLVIACKLSNASISRYYEIAKKHKVEGRVILTNFVPLDHLIKLYNMAYVMAFPSQYEGFGLPVVEAMACGTPVLTSNNSSLGEIADGAAVLVNPFDTKDITRGLIEILESPNLGDLVKKGYGRIEEYTWESVAKKTLSAFETIGSNKGDNNLRCQDKKKIAFFSPLPPLQSGIADYSYDLLNELADFFDIDVYIDNNYKAKCEFRGNIKVFHYTEFYRNKNGYYDIIYQMGNSMYHAYMIDFIQEFPGTLVLHDNNLHSLIYHLSKNNKNPNFYSECLYEDFEKEMVDTYISDFNEGRTGLKIYDLIANGIVSNYSKRIIVHSDYTKSFLLEKNIERNVVKIQHYSKNEEQVDIMYAKEKLNIPTNTIVLSAFGHIHSTKRIIPMLMAFQRLKERENSEKTLLLYLVGELSQEIKQEVEHFILKNKLQESVIVTGYTDLSVFENYIDATDICLNLRYPYNGETSGSLMRILAKGKCVLVSNIGSFSEIPDECCIKIASPANITVIEEVNIIFRELIKLVENPNLIDITGKNAKYYSENNLDIKLIIKQYVNTIINSKYSNLSEAILTSIVKDISQSEKTNIMKIASTIAYSKS